MSKLETLNQLVNPHLYVDYYNPGGGGKYKFSFMNSKGDTSYFGMNSVYTAIGYKEALTFAIGYNLARLHTQERMK